MEIGVTLFLVLSLATQPTLLMVVTGGGPDTGGGGGGTPPSDGGGDCGSRGGGPSDGGTARRLGGRSPLLHRTVVRPVAPEARQKWRLHAFASWSWTRWHARQPQQTITRLLLVWRLSVAVMVTGVGRWLRRHLQCQDRQVMVH